MERSLTFFGSTASRSFHKAVIASNPRPVICSNRTVGFPLTTCRKATQSSLGGQPSGPARKQVTIASDDGRVNWNELSAREKAARTTQQTFNLLTVVVGVVMTGAVATFLYLEVFSPDSATSHFNQAVNRIKKDPGCIELLGASKQIKAYGEPTWNKWARARPIASKTEKDRTGADHLLMHFYVEGPLNKGVVNLHMVKKPSDSEYTYRYLALDVKGHPRLYLENADSRENSKVKAGKMFGVRWW